MDIDCDESNILTRQQHRDNITAYQQHGQELEETGTTSSIPTFLLTPKPGGGSTKFRKHRQKPKATRCQFEPKTQLNNSKTVGD